MTNIKYVSGPNAGPKYEPWEIVALCNALWVQHSLHCSPLVQWIAYNIYFLNLFCHWHFKFWWISHCVLGDNCRVEVVCKSFLISLLVIFLIFVCRSFNSFLFVIFLDWFVKVKKFQELLNILWPRDFGTFWSDLTLQPSSWTLPGSFCQEPPASVSIVRHDFENWRSLAMLTMWKTISTHHTVKSFCKL